MQKQYALYAKKHHPERASVLVVQNLSGCQKQMPVYAHKQNNETDGDRRLYYLKLFIDGCQCQTGT